MVEPCREAALLPALLVSRQGDRWINRLARHFGKADSLAARRSLGVESVGSRTFTELGRCKREQQKLNAVMSLDTRRRARRRARAPKVRPAARTTKSAALGRHDDSLAARRSLGVAGVGSDRAEPAMRRGGREAR